MDELDLRAYQMLTVNARITYREMSETLGVNVPTAHGRIKGLIDNGIFTRFYATISPSYLNAVTAQISGVSRFKPLGPHLQDLVKKDFVEKAFIFGSNLIIVKVIVPRYEFLGNAVEHVHDALDLQDFQVMLPASVSVGGVPIHNKFVGSKELAPMDYRIINALHDDSRRPLVDVAEELDVSVKTVKGRLDRLIESRAIDFGIHWSPEKSSGIAFVVMIDLKPETNKEAFARVLNERFGPHIILTMQYHNKPNFMTAKCWFPTMDRHSEFVSEVEGMGVVKSVNSRVIQSTHLYETWRDRVLRERADAKKAPTSP
ncbi:MAG: AsnC family transcriptional regulator [Methanomassiliicoccus sp.]|nr:AsnC family transcriptional regulator [Methanomassiliicoccus sp.]